MPQVSGCQTGSTQNIYACERLSSHKHRLAFTDNNGKRYYIHLSPIQHNCHHIIRAIYHVGYYVFILFSLCKQ